MKMMLAIFVAALLTVALTTIYAEEEEKKKSDQETEEQEVMVNYQIIQQGTYSGKKDATAQVIATQQEWEQLWKQHTSVLVPQPPLPEVNFENEVVAAIFAGEKNTGGYAVKITNVSAEMDDVIVEYKLTEPQQNSFNIQVITQPFALLKIDKPKGTVKLVKH
jgi:hypothetical protein